MCQPCKFLDKETNGRRRPYIIVVVSVSLTIPKVAWNRRSIMIDQKVDPVHSLNHPQQRV
jgi:hypothetical protein